MRECKGNRITHAGDRFDVKIACVQEERSLRVGALKSEANCAAQNTLFEIGKEGEREQCVIRTRSGSAYE